MSEPEPKPEPMYQEWRAQKARFHNEGAWCISCGKDVYPHGDAVLIADWLDYDTSHHIARLHNTWLNTGQPGGPFHNSRSNSGG
jgi:hypothetical protein